MVQFDESKVINALHTEKAEVGKKYYVSDRLVDLRMDITNGSSSPLILIYIREEDDCYPFICNNMCCYQFLYPYEEPSEQGMTNLQIAEWLAKGNGQWKYKSKTEMYVCTEYMYDIGNENKQPKNIVIRPWGSDKWVKPTVAIYERDCKKR